MHSHATACNLHAIADGVLAQLIVTPTTHAPVARNLHAKQGEGGMPFFSWLSANPAAPTSSYRARKEIHPPAPDTPARPNQEPAPAAIPCKPPHSPPPKPVPRF